MSCADFRQNWDNVDYRHINHLTLHTMQAIELAKHVKKDTELARPRLFEITTLLHD